ncbi:hypothetical protein EFS21_06185 [Levilactobacillus brevis]|uniref:Uncharacterized protein n=3 Tax=Levilactobacillus brevis TaxID=1580 RepID=Q03T78_LEVBA|nr:hypothetical protein LVIS_0436 [Levilactobacillus brevis ATCC 367]ARW21351.1 hypothetical protein S101174_00473 [Levilactobacillus brevis]ERK43178.1 hypothetical protein HMPREF0495_01647 [Levilactobacillus brevis ATCC 14869 = DSM 20054]ATU69993.1 hypothetical protein CT113_06465 [Levilactobacillus brevis]KLE28709.1 hypothetical protein AAX72_12430 [Levilactobacillus brevis]
MRILGIIFVVLSLICITFAKFFVKTRLFFGDTSMIKQYIWGIILLIPGLILLYFSGAFTQ